MTGVIIDPDRRLSADERQTVQKLLAKPLEFPDEFKSWLSDYIATNIPKLPISQVFGFKLENANVATPVAAQETTTSTSYVDLGSVGPQLTGLSDGFYIVMWGAFSDNSGGDRFMAPSINGAAASDADAASTSFGPLGRALITQVSGASNNNSIVMKYRVASGSGDFEKRWLVAMRVTTNA